MAYNVDTDYTAQNDALKKQLAAATDSATKAALQAQIDANDASRTEKLASDLTTFGKYATDSELNNAAGIMAQNQIGTTYETQARNINTNYDKYKQNANNDALSRGMARSSFVSDRMANLDSQRGTALTDNDAAKASAIQNARTNIIDNYRTNAKNDVAIAKADLANEKSEFANTIGAYYNDYQAEVNKVQGNNDPSDDWKIPYLKQARNEKILAQQAAALKAAKSGSSGGSYSGGSAVDNTPVVDNDIFNAPQSEQYTGALNDAAASYQVGMNRTAQGQLATVQKLLTAGQITEAQAQALINKFRLSA